VVQAFLNTHFDLEVNWGEDVLSSPGALAEWFERHGVSDGRASRRDLERALELRTGLRALAAQNRNGAAVSPDILAQLDAVATGAPSEVRFGSEGRPRFVAAAGSGLTGALGALVAMTAVAMIDGSWARLKLCPGEHCGWAFYDHSRNQSGRWCSMSVCGGRAKARAHYLRTRSAS
jgi:predicted RNA-binding Zn ribbon-like protein